MISAILLFLMAFGLAIADVAHFGRSYLPPARTVALPLIQSNFFDSRTSSFTNGVGYSDRLVEMIPATNYEAPASANFRRTNFVSSFNAPARLAAQAPQNFNAPATPNFVAPVSQNLLAQTPRNFPAPAPASAAFTAEKCTSERLAQPSRQYLTPEVETLEPTVVQQRYTAPVISDNEPARLSSSSAFTDSSADIDTKYSADGGYVY